jgi:hypothetical protein
MAKKSSERGETTRREARTEGDHRAGKLLAGTIIAIAGMMLVFDDDEDGTKPSE